MTGRPRKRAVEIPAVEPVENQELMNQVRIAKKKKHIVKTVDTFYRIRINKLYKCKKTSNGDVYRSCVGTIDKLGKKIEELHKEGLIK